MLDKLDKLKQGKWQNEYLLSLAIISHVREVLLLSDYATVHKTAENLFAVDKEMMDLFILLQMWANDNPELLEARLEKFIKKANA